MPSLKRVLLTFAVLLGVPAAVAQPQTWKDVDMNRQPDAAPRDPRPNFDDLNRTGAGWENTPPAQHLSAPPRRNPDPPMDFGAGTPQSVLDPGQTGPAAIKALQDRMSRLDEAAAEIQQEQEDLALGLRACQKVVDEDAKYYADMVAIGALAPEAVDGHVKLGIAIVREIKQRLAEAGQTLQKMKEQRSELSLQLQYLQSSQQWANAFQEHAAATNVARTVPQPQPAAGCTLAGNWSNQIPGIGSSNWSIDDKGVAREGGMGGATGTATLAGKTLTIEWKTVVGQEGTYVIQLNDNCTAGKGAMRQTKAPPGVKLLAGDCFFSRLR